MRKLVLQITTEVLQCMVRIQRDHEHSDMFLSSDSGHVGGEHGHVGAPEHSEGEHDEAGARPDDGDVKMIVTIARVFLKDR